MVGSKETPQIRSRLEIITEPRRQRFLSWCMRGFWPPEDDKDESIMSFSSLFTAVPSDIFARYLKVIKTCVKDDTVSNIPDSAKVKSSTRKLRYWRILFNTKQNRLKARKLASMIFQIHQAASMEWRDKLLYFCLDWVQNTQHKILKIWKWWILIMQVTQETLFKSYSSRTCSNLKRDPQTEQLPKTRICVWLCLGCLWGEQLLLERLGSNKLVTFRST